MVRLGFLVLIALSLLIQLGHGQRGDAAADPAATLVSDLRRMNIETHAVPNTRIFEGRAAGCTAQLHFVLLRIDGADDEMLRALDPRADLIRYVYLGSVRDRRDWTGVTIRSALASASFTVGLRSVRPRPDMVVVALPRACPDLATRDWSKLSPAD